MWFEPPSWLPERDEDWPDPPEGPQLEESENPVVAEIYGPNEELLSSIHERAWVPFGFSTEPKSPTRVRRANA